MDYIYYLTIFSRNETIKEINKKDEQNLLLITEMEKNGDYNRTKELYLLYIKFLNRYFHDNPRNVLSCERGDKALYHAEEYLDKYGIETHVIYIYLDTSRQICRYEKLYKLLLRLYDIPEFRKLAIIELGSCAYDLVSDGIITGEEEAFFVSRSDNLKIQMRKQNCGEIIYEDYIMVHLRKILHIEGEKWEGDYNLILIRKMEESKNYNKTENLYSLYINNLDKYYNRSPDFLDSVGVNANEIGEKLMYHLERYFDKYRIDFTDYCTNGRHLIYTYLSVAAKTGYYESGYNLLLKLYNTPGFRDFAVIELGNRAIEYRRAGLIAEEKCYSLIERRDALKAEYGI